MKGLLMGALITSWPDLCTPESKKYSGLNPLGTVLGKQTAGENVAFCKQGI